MKRYLFNSLLLDVLDKIISQIDQETDMIESTISGLLQCATPQIPMHFKIKPVSLYFLGHIEIFTVLLLDFFNFDTAPQFIS